MLTQDDYNLYTGLKVCYSDTAWQTLTTIAANRLASFLCLEELPEITADTADLAMLLANFIAAMLRFQGNYDAIDSKSVRNFTIKFKSSATNAFGQIYDQYEDIIEKYTACGTEIKVERSERCWCENRGYFNF